VEISLPSKTIDPQSKKEKLPRFQCKKCGTCCRTAEILVTVTDSDILRISQTLGLTAAEILKALDFYVLESNIPTPIGLERIPSIITERGKAYVALKKMENGDCIFLKDDECMIHPIRPMVCRAFPFVFNESKGELSWGFSSKKRICPGLGVGPRVSEEELIHLAKEILTDIKNYQIFADSWNRRSSPKTALGFVQEALTLPL